MIFHNEATPHFSLLAVARLATPGGLEQRQVPLGPDSLLLDLVVFLRSVMLTSEFHSPS
jgi:hypothetical protein